VTTSARFRRTILAFWLSPLVAPVLLCAIGLLSVGAAFPGFGKLAGQIVAISIYALPVSYAGLVVFGVPTLILLERFGRLNLLWLVACAAVEGFVALYLFIAASRLDTLRYCAYALQPEVARDTAATGPSPPALRKTGLAAGMEQVAWPVPRPP